MDEFADRLLSWYDREGRKDLPWQHPRTPYRVWLSEIMLQQTQVNTVIPYFLNFLQHFPTVVDLANAELDEVLRHWAGLGYYARARNLHAAAQLVRDRFAGEFPSSQENLENLPGIGRSTAGAIRAQAFAQRGVIQDGNVRRVLCRYHAIEQDPTASAVQKLLWQLANEHTPDQRHADYAQAIMDLGATLCSRKPQCQRCPLASRCQALKLGIAAQLPARKSKAGQTRRIQKTTMLLLQDKSGRLFLQRRPPAGIWGGMLCPPMVESAEREGFHGVELPLRTHSFSHFDLHFQPLIVEAENLADQGICESDNGYWYHLHDAPPGGFPAPVKKLFDELKEGL